MNAWEAIFGGAAVPALITGLFTVYLRRFNRTNTAEHAKAMERREEGHAENMRLRMESKQQLEHIAERIDEVRDDVKEVRKRQDDHLEWHAEQN